MLKDEDTIASCGIKPNDFLVVMVTKAKKPAAAPAAPAETPKAAEAPKPEEAPTDPAPSTAQTPAAPASTTVATPAAPTRSDIFSQEAVDNLTAMGFPEAEVRHCLRAAQGNPDVAVEFLTNGIPDAVSTAMNATGSSATPAQATQPLQALRNHPQFNELRRLVQSNPQMLQQVLAQIGQQQPELLQEINANQALFLEMMNEPVTAAPPSASTANSSTAGASESTSGMGMSMDGMGNPAQMAQMIQSMSPAELDQMAQMMGLSSDQLRMTAQMLGHMPPEQLQQFMAHMGGSGEGPGGQQVLRLTEEEMAAVDRLAEMGFDRSEAAQAFIACDKNEALAANLLMDSMGDGGAFFGGNEDSGGGGDDNGEGGNDDEDMYD